ncbi:hypothetical protein AV530_012777 [Patagioenas fasciata monilis]|uniref:Uncharacterized protein n=1 Tax=Patagioenas fasciata monilis TaxID=372326 RepID=A0A1V4KDN7_PATFA|nr:hypothetical protein AV530_012777 [Patagioenas fasciata monilis]
MGGGPGGGAPPHRGVHPAFGAALRPLPRPQKRVQLRPDGAGGGRGGHAAPRLLCRPIAPTAAAAPGDPQQAAVSGGALRTPPKIVYPPPNSNKRYRARFGARRL